MMFPLIFGIISQGGDTNLLKLNTPIVVSVEGTTAIIGVTVTP